MIDWPNPVAAVDMSFDPLTLDEAKRLKDLGIELVIQCAWTGRMQPSVAYRNLVVAQEAELAIATYTSLPGGAPKGNSHVNSGLGVSQHDNPPLHDMFGADLRFNMVDIELPGITVEAVEDAYTTTRDVYNLRAPIYTSYNAWTNYVSPMNSSRLARLGAPLVNAFWDQDPDIDFSRLRYGSWRDEQLVGEQYTGGMYVGGQYVDKNVFKRSFVFPEQVEVPVVVEEPSEGEDDVALVLVRERGSLGVYLTNWLTRRYVGQTNPTSAAVAELQYIGVKGPIEISISTMRSIPQVVA